MKQNEPPVNLVSLSVRVPRKTADRLKQIADSEFRPVAAEIRRLIQERVDAADEQLERAA
jgi:predicted DNA-binding protein